MKKYVMSALLSVGLSVSAFANQTTPQNPQGTQLDPKYGGISACEITNSSGTSDVLCATGAGIILDVYASSVATTDMLVVRDSATANHTSTVLIGIDKNSLDKAVRIFPRFNNGLSVRLLTAATAATEGSNASRPNWVIIYSKDIK